MEKPLSTQPYIGRFAPSPTGDLHFGSLVTAVASYLEARHHQGQWHLRIDDLDEQRCIPGKDKELIESLEAFGFQWNGQIAYQSKTVPHYRAALEHLKEQGAVYACDCSRKQIQETGVKGIEGPVYPGTCKDKGLSLDGKLAIRVKANKNPLAFFDKRFGLQAQNIKQDVGDFIVYRADGYFAYQLAVVVDDYLAGITHVVRGADLLSSTIRQISLQQMLGQPQLNYFHVPLVLGKDGKKLSKSENGPKVNHQKPIQTLLAAWHYLGQAMPDEAPGTLEDFWAWASSEWHFSAVPREGTLNAAVK